MKVLDSAIAPGGYSASTNFQLSGAISQISIGPSQSSDFNLKAGWLYFPMVNTPIIAATAGNHQVALSWTPAIGILGWTVSGYSVGWSTTSGGPYTFTSVGAVTTYTKSGLTNDTPYYFVIKVKDNLNNDIATSTQVSATPMTPACGNGNCNGGETCSSCPADCGTCPPSGGGGGGGGGLPPISGTASATFKGRAYPLTDVILLRDGQLIATTKSGPDANFEISINGLTPGTYNFGVNSVDNSGSQSLTQTFPVTLTTGSSVTISGIFIAPSISVDKQEVKRGDNLAIFGQSVPNGSVVIAINSENEIFANTATDKYGAYLYNLDTSPLEIGGHKAKSKTAVATEISPFGKEVDFQVGTQNIIAKPTVKFLKGDMNKDGKVNLVDFSIAAYWYKRKLTGAIIATEKERLNGDGKIDLADFSIIAYYWTG